MRVLLSVLAACMCLVGGKELFVSLVRAVMVLGSSA